MRLSEIWLFTALCKNMRVFSILRKPRDDNQAKRILSRAMDQWDGLVVPSLSHGVLHMVQPPLPGRAAL